MLTQLDHYRLLGRSGLRVSPLCLGTMTFGTDWGWGTDKETSKQIFDAYVEKGGNFIDTANLYTNGSSEIILSDLIAKDRDRLVLATKYTLTTETGDPNLCGNHRKSMLQSVEASLKRLKTDYIDLFWMHAWDKSTPADEVMRGLDDLVSSGKIQYIAVSDTPAWRFAQMNTLAELRGWSRFIAVQTAYSLIRRDAERDIIPAAIEIGLAVLPWSPLEGGLLSGKYGWAEFEAHQKRTEAPKAFGDENRALNLTERNIKIAECVKEMASEIGRTPAQVALNWLLCQPGVTAPILGARKLEQFTDNLGCLDFKLDDSQLSKLNEVSAFELGFPHDFLAGDKLQMLITAGTIIE